ncbi:MAG: hypothetical protein ACLF0P_00530 [Thermoanaerobaculia bacterium]
MGQGTREARELPEVEPVRLRSLAFGDLLDAMVAGGAYRFLDLGPAVGPNIEYLSRCALSVQVADLWSSLARPEPRAWDRALEALAPEGGGPGYHAVLAWDLLNYLDREQLHEMADRLAAVTRPGGYVYTLVYYSREMPAEPVRFRIADRETLTHRPPVSVRPAPRYPQGLVEQAFQGFRIERGYLLKTGLHEFLFERKADAAAPQPGPDGEGSGEAEGTGDGEGEPPGPDPV